MNLLERYKNDIIQLLSMDYKKSVFFGIIFACVLCALIQNTSASLGVRPAYYEVNFVPGLEETYKFEFFQDNSETELRIYADGDLAQYVTLSTTKITGTGSVEAKLILPKEIEVPGLHKLYIGATQVVSDRKGFGLSGSVAGIIKIRGPYPGQYLEIQFETKNAKVGENVDFKLHIVNLGKESVVANSRIEIYDISGEKLLKIITFDPETIESTNTADLEATLETTDYRSGDYKAVAIVNYGNGKIAKQEGMFRLGEVRVDIFNYTSVFSRNLINRMEIRVESFWNDPIDNLYATVTVPGTNIYFQTPSITIKGFEKSMLTGFFDTSEIKEEPFNASIVLHYSNRTSEKIAMGLTFKKTTNYMFYAMIAGAALIVIIVIAVFLFILWRSRKNAAKKK